MNRSTQLTALAAVAALAAGCAPRVPPPELSLEPAELLAQVRAAQAKVGSVRGEARVGVKAPSGSGTVTELVAAERPDRLRIETLDFFGNPVAVLAAADGRFALWDAREKVFYRGEATPENLARLVPLPLPAGDLVSILCGAAPIAPDAVAVRAEPGKGFVTLVLEAGGREQVLRVGAGAAVDRSVLEGPGGYRLRFEHRGAREGAERFPAEVSLGSDAPQVALDLSWREVVAGAAHDPALFRLEPPRGARVVELGNGAPPSPFDGDRPPAAP